MVGVPVKTATAAAAVCWGLQHFGGSICLLSSMQDTVLIDITMSIDRTVPVVFLDNGCHFPETLAVVQSVEQRYNISVEVVRFEGDADFHSDPFACCAVKPGLLDRALVGRDAWISGVRRLDSVERASADIIERDARGLAKINPLVQWSDMDVDAYVEVNNLIEHPLRALGYGSIGCQPCTQPALGGDLRSGRWAGSGRTECGLHHLGASVVTRSVPTQGRQERGSEFS